MGFVPNTRTCHLKPEGMEEGERKCHAQAAVVGEEATRVEQGVGGAEAWSGATVRLEGHPAWGCSRRGQPLSEWSQDKPDAAHICRDERVSWNDPASAAPSARFHCPGAC